jgi:hypothetical protein
MESIYYVMTWLCHRTCEHCYEDRFRPYYGADRERVAGESRAHFRRIMDHFPQSMQFVRADGSSGRGRVILAGGEVLLEAVRESVLYPGLEQLRARYRDRGGVQLIVQTTGDLVTPRIVEELLARGANVISVSGLDAYHAGLEREEARTALQQKLTKMFDAAGMTAFPTHSQAFESPGPHYHFFGATPDQWIGKIWPRGRAWQNSLSTATIADNFCNAWSGGVRFLEHGRAGSEVSVEPNGNVYPCCMKTQLAIGNLLEEPLESILARRRGDPVYEAINAGQPQRMGLAHGWSEQAFLEKSRTLRPDGTPYQNLCIGCDAFHREVLAPPALVQIAEPHPS